MAPRLPITEILEPEPSGPDWAAVERDYRTGKFTLRELEAKHPGASRATIARRARDGAWVQDLSDAIAAATKARLAEHAAAKAVRQPPAKEVRQKARARDRSETSGVLSQAIVTRKDEAAALEKQAATEVAAKVAAVADEQAWVTLGQRDRATRLGQTGLSMLDELAAAAGLAEHADRIVELLSGGDDEDADPQRVAKVREAVSRALGLGSRAATLRALADVLAKAQAMERQAYGLDQPQAPGAGLGNLPPPESIPPEQCMAVYLQVVTGVRAAAPVKPGSLTEPARIAP